MIGVPVTPNAIRTSWIVGAKSFQLRNKSLELARKCKLGEWLWLSLLRRIFVLIVVVVVVIMAIFITFSSLCGGIIERDAPSRTRNTQWHQLLRQR
jgi:hypothetical protein